MAYAILRIQKHSSNGSLGGMTKHNKREIDVPNADKEKSHLNREIIGTGDYVEDVNAILNDRQPLRQKNSVIAIEHILTASPEWWNENPDSHKRSFINEALKFVKDYYGEYSEIASASLHMDEATPHMHVFVVPIRKSHLKGGKEVFRLGAKQFVDGRNVLSKMQDEFADRVKHLGLQRGIKNSKAKHQSLKKLYASVNGIERFAKSNEITAPVLEGLPPILKSKSKREEWLDQQNQKIANELKEAIEKYNSAMEQELYLSLEDQIKSNKLKREKIKFSSKLMEQKRLFENRMKEYLTIIAEYKERETDFLARETKLSKQSDNLTNENLELRNKLDKAGEFAKHLQRLRIKYQSKENTKEERIQAWKDYQNKEKELAKIFGYNISHDPKENKDRQNDKGNDNSQGINMGEF